MFPSPPSPSMIPLSGSSLTPGILGICISPPTCSLRSPLSPTHYLQKDVVLDWISLLTFILGYWDDGFMNFSLNMAFSRYKDANISSGFHCKLEMTTQGKQDGSAGECAYGYVWWPEFSPQDPACSREGEDHLLQASCPLVFNLERTACRNMS